MDTSKYIRNGDFCQIVSDKFEAEHGVKRNTIVYVVGTKALPMSEEDPYTQRIKMIVHIVDHNLHVVFDKMYIMDPDSLHKVDDSKQRTLTKILEMDFDLPEAVKV